MNHHQRELDRALERMREPVPCCGASQEIEHLLKIISDQERTRPIVIEALTPEHIMNLKNVPHYVVGFCFMPDVPSQHNQFQAHEVVLIRKNRPDWQKGKLNGVGGRVEEGETPKQAMEREFSEETGRPSSGWRSVLDMVFPDCVVHVFMLRLETAITFDKGLTDEPIEVWNVRDLLPYRNKIDNLNWLIPMALCCAPPHSVPKIFFESV